MSETIEIKNNVFWCLHPAGVAVCPMCGKPCDQDWADWVRARIETSERGHDCEQ